MKNIAIVGVGHRAQSWVGGIVADHAGEAQVNALVDPMRARSERINEKYKLNAGIYENIDEFLDKHDPQGVVVITPERYHAENINKALDAGHEVATEKPLCTTIDQVKSILDTNARANHSLYMGFNYRHVPLVSKIKETLMSGVIGDILSVDLNWYLDKHGHGASYFRRWHRQMEMSGGLLVTKASHHFDMVNWFVGDYPEYVAAYGQRNLFGKDKSAFAGTRCSECEHGPQCSFYDERNAKKLSEELGYKVEEVANFGNDLCVFSDEIDIYDTMGVMTRYCGGTIFNYSLNVATPFEGWVLAINGSKGRLESKITDGKPVPSWQKQFKLMRGESRVRDEALQLTDWPDQYAIQIYPVREPAYEIEVPLGVGGHGGGDPKIIAGFVDKKRLEDDPLNVYAGATDGAMSAAIGAAANLSIKDKRMVDLKEDLGTYLN